MIDAGDIGEPLYMLFDALPVPLPPRRRGWRYERDRVGSWILEEPVHAFDFALWYFERWGDPTSSWPLGNGKAARRACTTTSPRCPLPRRAARRHHPDTGRLRVPPGHGGGRTEGAIRAWWSGTLDRTLRARVRADGAAPRRPSPSHPDRAPASSSSWRPARPDRGGVQERRPLVTGEEARKRVDRVRRGRALAPRGARDSAALLTHRSVRGACPSLYSRGNCRYLSAPGPS